IMNNKFFMTYVEGGSTPTIKHTCKNSAENEAQRLANKLSKKVFVLEAVSETTPDEISIKVDSYEAALEYLGRESGVCMCGMADKHAKAMMAMYQLITIAEAWNKADEFVPNFDNTNQYKWFPWFRKQGAAGFVFAYTAYTATSEFAYIGSRLCFKSEERATQFGKQFISLWNGFLLF
ncbi:MAG: hypothetical protein RSE25_09445, partial [Bacteroidales bacterium]